VIADKQKGVDEFNVDSNVECDQLNLAHVATKNI